MSSTQLGSFTSITSDPFLETKPFFTKSKQFSKKLQDPKILSDKALDILTALNKWESSKQEWTHSNQRQKFYESMYDFKNRIKTQRNQTTKSKIKYQIPPPKLRFSNLTPKFSKKSQDSTLLFSQKCRLSRGKNINRHKHQLLGTWEQKRLKLNLNGSLNHMKRQNFTLLNYHYIEGLFYYPANSLIEAVALMVFEISSKYIPYLFDQFKWTFLVSYLRWFKFNPHISVPKIIQQKSLDEIKSIFLEYLQMLQKETTRSILQRYNISWVANLSLRHNLIDSKCQKQQNLRNWNYDCPELVMIRYLEQECGFTVEYMKQIQMKVNAENHQFTIRWENKQIYYKLNY